MKIVINNIFLLFAFSCANNTTSDFKIRSHVFNTEIINNQNIIVDSVRTIGFGSSDFEMRIYCLGDNERLFPVYVRDRKTGKELYLFDIFHLIASNNPEHLFGDYYSFHFDDTGNSIYAQGFYLIKVTSDTAFMIAPYWDMRILTEMGKRNSLFTILKKWENHMLKINIISWRWNFEMILSIPGGGFDLCDQSLGLKGNILSYR